MVGDVQRNLTILAIWEAQQGTCDTPESYRKWTHIPPTHMVSRDSFRWINLHVLNPYVYETRSLSSVFLQRPLILTLFNPSMDRLFHPTPYWAHDYLSILGWKLIHVSKGAPADYKETHVFNGFHCASIGCFDQRMSIIMDYEILINLAALR